MCKKLGAVAYWVVLFLAAVVQILTWLDVSPAYCGTLMAGIPRITISLPFVVMAIPAMIILGYVLGRPRRYAQGLSILRAEYGWGDTWQDVTRRLQTQVTGGRLSTQATNENLGGDPVPHKRKDLRVEYSVRQHKKVRERETLELP